MRGTWRVWLAVVLVAGAGIAGLVRGAVPQAAAPTTGPKITVSGGYVREPASAEAALYFTVTNAGDQPDQLVSVTTGAGAVAELHSADMSSSGPVTIAPHSSLTLSPGGGHVMIEQLYGALRPGQSVSVQLQFATSGPLLVTVPVVGILDPAPTASNTGVR